MLEPILQGLIEWLYSLLEDIADYFFGDIIDVLTMDMEYFRKVAPIVDEISEVILALAWALLIGNLVFQAIKSMMSGAGFDGEDPRLLFLRTFVFSFLLLSSRQICDMCTQITGKVVALISIQQNFTLITPAASMFSGAGSVKWLISIIVGVFLIIQMIKLFFDIGERYVISCVLTFMAPLAFAMGASKNTSDIFKGWCRMYGSMNLMLIMNIIFLKLITSAMMNMSKSNIILWFVFVLALTRVARKIDAHIAKIGLNPAQTNNSIGLRVPGGLTMVVVRTLASLVSKGATNMKGSSGGSNRPSGNYHHSHNTGTHNNSRTTNTNNNTAGRGQNATQPGDTNVNVSVNQGRGAAASNRGGRSADRQGRNAANTGSRYGSQSTSDRKTDTSRESRGRDTGNATNGNSNSSQRANPAKVQASVQVPARSVDGKAAAIQATTGTTIRTRDTEPRASRDHTASHDRNDHSRSPASPPLSRNTGNNGASSHSSARANSNSNSANRPNPLNAPKKVDINVSGANGSTPAVTVPATPTVQSRSRVTGSMAASAPANYSDTDVSKTDRRDGNTVDSSFVFNTSNRGGGRRTNTNYANNVGNYSGLPGADHHGGSGSTSYSSATHSMTNVDRRIDHEHKFGRYDPAAVNRKGRRNYYTKDVSTADRYKRGDENGKTAEKRNAEGGSRSAGRRRHS